MSLWWKETIAVQQHGLFFDSIKCLYYILTTNELVNPVQQGNGRATLFEAISSYV
jgi:hypothetical protein